MGNFFDNLAYPIVIVNDLFQGKFKQAGADTGRFLLNSTMGLGGLLDPGSEVGPTRRGPADKAGFHGQGQQVRNSLFVGDCRDTFWHPDAQIDDAVRREFECSTASDNLAFSQR